MNCKMLALSFALCLTASTSFAEAADWGTQAVITNNGRNRSLREIMIGVPIGGAIVGVFFGAVGAAVSIKSLIRTNLRWGRVIHKGPVLWLFISTANYRHPHPHGAV